jgi:Ca-activated chloride channel family protein
MRARRFAAWLVGVAFLTALFLCPAGSPAQVVITPRHAAGSSLDVKLPTATLRIDSNLVLVPVSVCDPMNRPVTGLEKEHFKIFDDKVEQTVTHFSMEDEPLSVGLVFDTSGSMGTKLHRSRLAAAEFFKSANPEDDFFLVEFSEQPKLIVPLTQDSQEIQNHLAFAPSKGRTALLDAILLAMHEMKKSTKNRKALLIISDGGDNCSRYSETEVRDLVRESDVLVYALGIYEPYSARGRSPEEMAGPDLLSEMAEQTGGRHFAVDDINEMPDIAAKIGIELRNSYVLGYTPQNTLHDGRYHRVQVKLQPPHGLPALKAFWRLGYYAPAQ